ncbi:hypothetical protein C9413_29685 [Rhizobium sp. SEMIA 4085]|uniref:hypothetical protein n=1 Tax=Rhizobium sp. SEMIA 4085 TaxID=2137761 RepID=UPI0014781D9B|nr:hypothetical protein [Rhizobium sp. SEMIA 4085]NNH33425.1 hypothetical protein [Rhizobium sp. SEMIA 4085]
MRNVILAAAFLLPSVALAAEAVEVRARDLSCGELAQFIRQNKTVFVRIGIGGRRFRYPPARGRVGEKQPTHDFRGAREKQLVLSHAVGHEPASFYK